MTIAALMCAAIGGYGWMTDSGLLTFGGFVGALVIVLFDRD